MKTALDEYLRKIQKEDFDDFDYDEYPIDGEEMRECPTCGADYAVIYRNDAGVLVCEYCEDDKERGEG